MLLLLLILGFLNWNMLLKNPQQPSKLSKNHLSWFQFLGARFSTLVLKRTPRISELFSITEGILDSCYTKTVDSFGVFYIEISY